MDRNDDGKATDDEVDWKVGHQLGGWIDPETLTLYTTPAPSNFSPVHRYEPSKITPGGVPLYSAIPSARTPVVAEPDRNYPPDDYRRDSSGNTFGCI